MIIGSTGTGFSGILGGLILAMGEASISPSSSSQLKLLKRAVARRRGRGEGALQFRHDERFYVLTADAQDGCWHTLAGQEGG